MVRDKAKFNSPKHRLSPLKSTENFGLVSCTFSVAWLAADVKQPTHFSKRGGHPVPGVVVFVPQVGAKHRVNLSVPFPLGVTEIISEFYSSVI